MRAFVLPRFPISDDVLADATQTRNFLPILHDMYIYISRVAITCAEIHPSSAGVRPIPELNRAVLAGLLCRCCRLMYASIKLSDDGLFGETIAILQRCITETAFRIRWLCKKNDPSEFERYMADGLKKEVALREQIRSNIRTRGGQMLAIEKRMLDSTGRMLEVSGMTEEQVSSKKNKMPDFKTICTEIDLGPLYLAVQKLGSHSIHGNWPDLLEHYISRQADGLFELKDHSSHIHANQYLFPSLFVISATKDYLQYIAGHIWSVEDLAPELIKAETILEAISKEQSVGDYEAL